MVGRTVICDAVCNYHDCLAMALFMEPLRSALFLARAARKWYLFETTPLCAARWVLVECGVFVIRVIKTTNPHRANDVLKIL